jgi:hypothetical protein
MSVPVRQASLSATGAEKCRLPFDPLQRAWGEMLTAFEKRVCEPKDFMARIVFLKNIIAKPYF